MLDHYNFILRSFNCTDELMNICTLLFRITSNPTHFIPINIYCFLWAEFSKVQTWQILQI